MGGIARFVTGIGCLARAISAGELHEEILAVDELIAGVVRNGVHARVHANGIAGTSFDAESAEDAAELVDDERFWITLVAALRIAFGVFVSFDVDALRGARGGAAQAGYAAR